MNRVMTVAALAVAGLTAACGGVGLGGRAEGTMEAAKPCGALYTAALMAVPEVGYRLTSSDRAGGVIMASQDVALGGGSSVGLTVTTVPHGRGCLLTAVVMMPPAGLSLTPLSITVDSYIAAVQARSGAAGRLAKVR